MGAAFMKYGAEGLGKIWDFISGQGAKEVAKEAPKVTKESLKEMGEYASKQIGQVAQKGSEAVKSGISKLNDKLSGKLSIKGNEETAKVAEKVAAQAPKADASVAASIEAMANGGGTMSAAAMEKLAAKEGSNAAKTAEKIGAETASEGAEAAAKVESKRSFGKQAFEFVKKHPKGTAIAAGAGTVVVAPELAGKAVTAIGGAAVQGSTEFAKTVATEVTEGVKDSTKEFFQNIPDWVLPTVGIGAGALLLGRGGLGSIAKVGLLAGVAVVGYNAIKGMNQPANQAIADTMDSVEKQSRTDTLFGKSKELSGETQREMVDTSNLSETTPEVSQQQFN